jgi:predicted Zn-dependent protease
MKDKAVESYQGYYADGTSAERRPVRVALGEGGLAIRGSDGVQIALWPYRSLRMIEEVYRDQPIRLRSASGGDGRLSVRDQRILDALRAHAPGLGGGDLRRHRALPRAVIWTAATVAALVGLYFGLPLLAEPIAAMVPRSWEEKLGQSVMRQVELVFGGGQLRDCDAPAGRAALDGLVRRLAATADTDYVFRVRVLDNSIVNALAAPGGYVVIFRGLIDKAKSAEEVAGVLAHEMGHVIERHGTEALIRQYGMQLIVGNVAEGATLDSGSVLLSLSYSRDAEREADRIGVMLLNRSDIRGAGLAGFFRRLSKESNGGSGGAFRYFATHPPSGERASDIEARALGKGEAMSAEEWQALRKICGVKN